MVQSGSDEDARGWGDGISVGGAACNIHHARIVEIERCADETATILYILIRYDLRDLAPPL